MAKIDIPNSEKCKEAPKMAKFLWKIPVNSFTNCMVFSLLLIILALATSLTRDMASLNEDVVSLKKDIEELKSGVNLILSKMCPEGWHHISGSCYIWDDTPMRNFSAAVDFCREKDAKVFEPKDLKINSAVFDWSKTCGQNLYIGSWAYWIGMVRTPGSDNWKWVTDNSTVSMTNWNKEILYHYSVDQPTPFGDCAEVGSEPWTAFGMVGVWFNFDCSEILYVICEKAVHSSLG